MTGSVGAARPLVGSRPPHLYSRRYVLACDQCELDTQANGAVAAGRLVAAHLASTGHRAVAHPATGGRRSPPIGCRMTSKRVQVRARRAAAQLAQVYRPPVEQLVDETGGSRAWRVRLPYTSPPLSANQRLHPMARHRLVHDVRADVATLCRVLPKLERVAVELHYVPRDRRRRDEENLAPLLKACIDALTPSRRTRKGVAPGAGVIPDDTPAHVVSATCHLGEPDGSGTGHLYLIVREVDQ